MNNKPDRQGDVFIRRVNEIPADVRAGEINKDGVVAWGEVTGHMHKLSNAARGTVFHLGEAGPVRGAQAGGKTYVEVTSPTELVHDEHAPINLDKGLYEIRIQREYTPEAIRNVAD